MAVELASELPGGWSVPWLPPERYVDLGGGRVAFVRDAHGAVVVLTELESAGDIRRIAKDGR